MKKQFITGLVILLPLTLTILFVSFIFNLLTDPFVGITQAIFQHLGLFERGFWIFSSEQIQEFAGKVCIVIFLLFFTIALGALARWYFIRYLLRIWDYILHRIPFISAIYKTCQDVIGTIFASKANSFKQVVLVPFPSANSRSIGLVTSENLPAISPWTTDTVAAVFVPTTPNPTSGFLVFYPEKDLIYLDMQVEEAFKYIISCGVVPTSLNSMTKVEAMARNAEIVKIPEKKYNPKQ